MKYPFSFGLLLILLTSSQLFTQESNIKSNFVTVYNNDFAVIRQIRNVDIPKGTSQIMITDVAQTIDPTSVHIKLDGKVLEQNYQYDLVSLMKILSKYINKEIKLIGKDVITGKLLSSQSNGIVLQNQDGGLTMLTDIKDYRINVGSLPEGLITKPTLVWTVDAKKSGKQDVEISYQARGMNWHAEYVAVLNQNDTKIDLNAWVSIDNKSGATYKDATLKLVAGDVQKYQPVQDFYVQKSLTTYGAVEDFRQFEEKQFFEYHIYELQRPSTIADNETKQISLFEASDIAIKKKYLYKSPTYSIYQGLNQDSKVAVIIEFNNTKENKLGIPMPKGLVRMNKSDGKSIEFIGEDMIDHTPRNEMIKLKVGEAFDVLANEIEKESIKISDNVREVTYQITLKNRKEENINIEVEKFLGWNWTMLSSTYDHTKKDARTVLFNVPVKKNSNSILEFKVRYN